MPQFTKLTGVTFTDTSLPILRDLGEGVANLPDLSAWVNANPNNYYLDQLGNLALKDLSPAGADFVIASNRSKGPSVSLGALSGYNVVSFAGNDGDTGGMQRSVSDAPVGADAEMTFAAVIRVTGNLNSNHNLVTTGQSNIGVPMYATNSAQRLGISTPDVNTVQDADLTKWAIVIGSISGGSVKLLSPVDLETISQSTGADYNTSSAVYLGQNNSTSSHLVGDVAELIVTYSDLLAEGNAYHLRNLLDYWKAKFGV
ncbi:hypothetical protein AAGT95_16630 [Salinicola lusitanus]|uniref:Uncharacterized protein n=1 Tax=Salinicola lusitanus TaxID=1949085 RepID=A0ABZ3CQM1_9GAMM